MLDILGITTPIFLLIGVGYLAMLGRIMTREHVQGISKFVLYCALPALIIKALTQNPLEEVFTPQYLLGYGLGSLAVFTLGVVALRVIGRKPLGACAIHALGMSASNSGFIGYPVAAMVLGPSAGVFLALNMLIENLLIIPAALILAEASQQHGQGVGQAIRQTAIRLARNPILIGLTVGLVLAITELPLPGALAKAIDMLAAAAAPAALFVIGATLYGLRITGMAGEVGQIVLTKLVIHPLAVLGVFLLIPDMDPALLTGALLFACAPMISIFPILGQRYGLQDISAAAMMVATLLSFVTISLVIGLMTYQGLLPA